MQQASEPLPSFNRRKALSLPHLQNFGFMLPFSLYLNFCMFICTLQLQYLNCGTRTERMRSPCKKLVVNYLHDIILGLVKCMRATIIFGKVSLVDPSFFPQKLRGKQINKAGPMCATNAGFTPFFHFRGIYPDRLLVLIIHSPLPEKKKSFLHDFRTLKSLVKQ